MDTERKRSEQRLTTQYAITRVLAESDTLAQAAPLLLQEIGKGMEWEWGALWTVDREAGVMDCCGSMWHAPNFEVADFDAISREITFTPGQGLPGRVWQSAEPAWITDVTKDSNFPRAAVAAKVGLRGAIAFPILLGGETLGVIEFFSRAVRQPDEEQLDTLSALGSQIGQFIERKRAQADIERSLSLLRATLESTADGILVIDLEGRIVVFNQKFADMWGLSPELLAERDDRRALAAVTDKLVDSEAFLARVRAVYSQPEEESFDTFELKDGRVFERYSQPQRVAGVSVGRVWSFRDVTAGKRAEMELLRLNRALRVLSVCNQAVTRSSDEVQLLEQVCHAIVGIGGYRLAWVAYAEFDEAKSVRPVARAGRATDYVDSISVTWADNELGRGPTGTAIRTGLPVVCNEILSDPRFLPWRAQATAHGLKSSVALPLLSFS